MKPNCMKCKHFFITYDKATPKGCKVYQIKSQQLPSQIVKDANKGTDCIGFEVKVTNNSNKSLSDSKYW